MSVTNLPATDVSFVDSKYFDGNGRLRVSVLTPLFDIQLGYGLEPLIFEQIASGTGATITHDTTNKRALMTFSSTPTGGKSYMQSYAYSHYAPGKSQKIEICFNFLEQVTNVLKFAGYSDGVNGFEFQNTGSVNQFIIYSSTTAGNQTATQSTWNLDRLDGTGPSGKTLDITKKQQLFIDFHATFSGRVRMGFEIDGKLIYAHQFSTGNLSAYPIVQTYSLPVRCGMTCTGTVSTTMSFIGCSVVSEGGNNPLEGYEFVQSVSGTSGNGVPATIFSIRPKTTFNGFTNRINIAFLEVDILVTGNSSVLWQLVLGQAITGTTTYTDVNTTYSAMEYNSAGTISGSPAIIVDAGYVSSTNQSSGAISTGLTTRYPITLDAAGAQRALGTLSLNVTGVSAATTVQATIKWVEIR